MTRLTFAEYLDHLRAESARFGEVLAQCDPNAAVPGCPAWNAADLLWHLTQVQATWAEVINGRPTASMSAEPGPRPADLSHPDLLTHFQEASTALVEALAAADPAEAAWSWGPEQTVGFTYRRQALEALVHRVDAEQAAGAQTPLDPRLAADGVDEVIGLFYGWKPPWGEFSPLPHHLRVDLTDADSSVWVQFGRFAGDHDGEHRDLPDLVVVPDPGVEPDAVISGSAEEVLLRLWKRGDGSGIHLAGDLKFVDLFRELTHSPLD